jgi:formylglycine-generating enzyme required for sulfatase activity
MLWDTDHSFEVIKNKRKNLNSLRSSVNADFKKLYEKGENPEGIKIGSSNTFVMSEEAKDKILKKFGYDLQLDGTLKLDQIMDILKLANETVSGSMAFEDKEEKGGLKKIDRLKDLIKGLSEKVGLSSPEVSKSTPGGNDLSVSGDEEGAASVKMAEIHDEGELAEIADTDADADGLDETDEPLKSIDDVLDEEDADLDEVEVVDDVENIEVDEIVDTDADADDLDETDELLESLDDVPDEEDTDLDEVEVVDDVDEIIGNEGAEEQAGISEPGDERALGGVGFEQETGQEDERIDIGGDKSRSEGTGTEGESVRKRDGDSVGDDLFVSGDEEGAASVKMAEIHDDGELAEIDDVENIEIKDRNGSEQLGLPVGSLGQDYSIETESKIKRNKLLSEEFDGFLGSMDRYYNQYILIPGGEYIIGSKHPKKDEKPEQTVYLEPFYFGRFPITNGLFEIFVEKTGYKTTAEKVGYGNVYYGRFEKKIDETTGLITSTWNASIYCKTVKGACWYQPSGPKSTLYNKRNHPVVQVSMEDAMAFAAWTGKRLPTENEWEAASRTANGWIFPWGQKLKKDAFNIEDSYTAGTTPVDKYVEFENEFGIVDTLGNVLEWTDSNYKERFKTNNREKYRVVRGGGWISGNDIRLFSRFMIEPESYSNILGFRCVAY